MCRVAAELMGVRGISFTHELLLPLCYNALGYVGLQTDFPNAAQPIEQFADVIRLGCNRHRLEPVERERGDRAVRDEKIDPARPAVLRHAAEQRIGRGLLAGTRPATAARSITAAGGRMIPAARSAVMTAATIG